jgi:hypothetical protein
MHPSSLGPGGGRQDACTAHQTVQSCRHVCTEHVCVCVCVCVCVWCVCSRARALLSAGQSAPVPVVLWQHSDGGV